MKTYLKSWAIVIAGLLQGKSLADIQYEEEGKAAKLRHMLRVGK